MYSIAFSVCYTMTTATAEPAIEDPFASLNPEQRAAVEHVGPEQPEVLRRPFQLPQVGVLGIS